MDIIDQNPPGTEGTLMFRLNGVWFLCCLSVRPTFSKILDF